jgi:beta-glucanase (GH16 family)
MAAGNSMARRPQRLVPRLSQGGLLAALALQAAACGGAGGGSSGQATQSEPLVGVFLDGAVAGLRYTTPSLSGTTDASGRYQYRPGESVVFSLGAIQLTSTAAKPVLTPLDVAGTTNPQDQRVLNMLVLLQSLDADANPANGITLPPQATALATSSLNFDVPTSSFRSNPAVTGLVGATSAGRSPVGEADARAHFQSTLNGGTGSTRIAVAPHAHAGAAQNAVVGAAVDLSASASTDANGDALTYQWSFVARPSQSTASLIAATSVAARFTPDVPGEYVLGLVVHDGTQASAMSTVRVTAAAGNQVPAGYRLVWADEFNTPGTNLPDANNWAYDTHRNTQGWYNNELQYYSNGRLQNSAVQNGRLLITARKESLAGQVNDWGGQGYTSARLITRGKASWTYGFFEIRAKLPCGTGTWPAIWTLGSSVDTWPAQGEIDIMEQTGWDKATVLATVHTSAGSGGNGSTGSRPLADACTAFHNYQIKWTPTAIDFYVDGVSFRPSYTKSSNPAAWPFDRPQYLLLNVAVGGVLGGTVNDATLSATGLEVDYVRVYQVSP